MTERYVTGLVGRKRQREAAKLRLHRIETVGLGVDGDEALVARTFDPGIEPIEAAHGLVFRAIEFLTARGAEPRRRQRLRRQRAWHRGRSPSPARGGGGGGGGREPGSLGAADLPPLDALCASSSPACGGGEEVVPRPTSFASGSISPASMLANSPTRRVNELNSIALRKAMSRLWSGSCTARSPIGTSSFTRSSRVTSFFDSRAKSALSSSDWRRFSCLISGAR